MSAGTDFELLSPPKDGISSVKFGTETDHLIASSWDAYLYLYDPLINQMKAKVPFEAALLDCCFGSSDAHSYAVGLNRQVIRIDWNTLQVSILGTHEDAIKAILRCPQTGLLFSGSWDRTLTVWDERAMTRAARLPLPGKVYSMDCAMGTLAVAMSDRHVQIYDTRKYSEPLQTRESALRHQTRCIRLFNDAQSFVISSIEGRVGVEFVDPEQQPKNFAFKCHRAPAPDQNNMEFVYPVNSLAVHPKFGTFCTGGSDGVVCIWDPVMKKRIKALPKYPSSIASLAFSRDGDLLAIASSYCYEEGEKDHPPDSVYIRRLDTIEARGKSAA